MLLITARSAGLIWEMWDNMRGFCLLHTLPSTHTFTPSCLGRQDHVASAVPPLLDAHHVAQVLERYCPPQCQHRSRAVAYTDVERRPIFNPSYIICGVFVYYTHFPLHTLLPHPASAGRTTSPARFPHSSMPTRSPRSWSATVHLSASTGAAL